VTIHPVVAARAKVEPLDNHRAFTLVAESVRRIPLTVTPDAAAKAGAAPDASRERPEPRWQLGTGMR